MTQAIDYFTSMTHDDEDRSDAIVMNVPGWSGREHYAFFKHAVVDLGCKDILMLGVYFGRDMCMILDISARYGKDVCVIGVDKFDDKPCADWTPEQVVDGHWQSNGFGMPPNAALALDNISRYCNGPGIGHNFGLVKADDKETMDWASGLEKRRVYDLAYLDTAHDYATVQRQLRQCKPLVRDGGWIAGDDYVDQGTWGVKSAVNDGTVSHVAKDRIWIARVEDVK